MLTAIEKKYAKLLPKKQAIGGTNAKHLVFPSDLTNISDSVGYAVVFQVNRIMGTGLLDKTNIVNIKGQTAGASTGGLVNRAFASEVSMQGEAGGASVRGKAAYALGAGKVYTATDEMIILPMPNQFNLTDSVQWNSTELGVLGRMSDAANSISEGDWQTLGKTLGTGAARTGAGVLQSLGLGKTKDLLELTSGTIQNPYAEVLFKGANNRPVPFQWNLTPRNAKDAEILKNLIHRFRFHMRPELKTGGTSNSSYLLAPSTFEIQFIDLKTGERVKWMPKLATCALTNFTTNGTPNGEYAATVDGQFTSVTLEMNFLELCLGVKDMMTDPDNSY